MAKKLVILKHGGGELANQLWNYLSISAYGLERDVEVRNPSFYEYHSSFNLIGKENFLTKTLSSFFDGYRGRRGSIRKKFWRYTYSIYSKIIEVAKKDEIVSSENTNNEVFYLPPTAPCPSLAEKESFKRLCFTGWLFRNPIGLSRYRDALVRMFTPHGDILKRASDIVSPLREKSEHVIGVHIRQGDYKTFKGGTYWIDQSRMREIMDEYMLKKQIDPDTVSFVLTSDGSIDKKVFDGLSITVSRENAVTDLYLLSKTDTIIGSDSSFGHFASWYGNIPHIVATKSPIDWPYYEDKNTYFENHYCTMVQF
jgi:hypothetical protein